MSFGKFSAVLSAVVGLSVAMSAPVRAEETAEGLLAEATQLFSLRGENANYDRVIELTGRAEALAGSNRELKYDILTLASRAYYFKGGKTTSDSAKEAIYNTGMQKADAAKRLFANLADAHYYYAINLGRWGEARGITTSLGRRRELFRSCEDAKRFPTRAGTPGEAIDGFGPDRTLGRVYFKLPALFDGSNERSMQHLDIAWGRAPENALNGVYYAEVLAAEDQEVRACAILNQILNDPRGDRGYNPDRVPETVDEFALARALKREICN